MSSYGSVSDGKWHITESAEPSFASTETSLCGVKFRPLNVSWREFPDYSHPRHLCKRCERKAQS